MSDEYLQDTDHLQLYKELKKVDDWYSLGLNFGIPQSELKRIEADHPSFRRRKQEVCAAFIRSNTHASWELVVRALDEMDEKRLARKIDKKYLAKPDKLSQVRTRKGRSSSRHQFESSGIGTSFPESESIDVSLSSQCGCGTCSVFKVCDEGCPNPNKHEVLPVLNEIASVDPLHRFHLEAQRQRETKQVMTVFANFVDETCKSIKKKVTVEGFAVWLKQLEAFDKVSHCSGSTPVLLAQQIDEISQAGSMERVFLILSDYWSWYNHYLLEEIVTKYGDQNDRRRLEDFKQTLSTYAQNRIGEFSQHEVTLGVAGGERRIPLLFKVDKDWDRVHINQLPAIHQNLASILGVNPHTLYLASIRRGCILMKFVIPSLVAQALFPLSSSQEEALAAASVMKVECGAHCHELLQCPRPQFDFGISLESTIDSESEDHISEDGTGDSCSEQLSTDTPDVSSHDSESKENKSISNHQRCGLLETIETLPSCGWYYGNITVDEAERLLRDEPNGSFLVRDSSDSQNRTDLFTITFKIHNRFGSIRVDYGKGYFSLSMQDPGLPLFHTMMDLIYYCYNRSVLQKLPVCILTGYRLNQEVHLYLTKPVCRLRQSHSLMYLCRQSLHTAVTKDKLDQLGLPKRLTDCYVARNPYFDEQLFPLYDKEEEKELSIIEDTRNSDASRTSLQIDTGK